jgi:hypothetical protein
MSRPRSTKLHRIIAVWHGERRTIARTACGHVWDLCSFRGAYHFDAFTRSLDECHRCQPKGHPSIGQRLEGHEAPQKGPRV